MEFDENIKIEFEKMSPERFKGLCFDLMKASFHEYHDISDNRGVFGQCLNGAPDAWKRTSDEKYIIFEFTKQKGSLNSKLLGHINTLQSSKYDLKNDIKKLVFCIAHPLKPKFEKLLFEQCKKLGWELEIHRFEKLARLLRTQDEIAQEYFNLPPYRSEVKSKDVESIDEDFYFLSGSRVKTLREERSLKPSQFLGICGIRSERILLEIEEDKAEFSSKNIKLIVNSTGVSEDWVKHGLGCKYNYQHLHYYSPKQAIERILKDRPAAAYFILNKDNFQYFIATEVSENRMDTFHVDHDLAFWNWFGDLQYVPHIYSFIKELHQSISKSSTSILGRIVDEKTYADLTSSEKWIGNAVKSESNFGNYWLEDLIDVNNNYRSREEYKGFYGENFLKIQDHFLNSQG